ncbi:adenosylcobinamide-GDP ribazoletransferase [Rhodococcus sp. D2-41]|uniref:Adenosylcobinamide-GDP ribazoletransferase n=1 Tax=Speluncibacter jeojiensis TaxID=2710754 RepID=A0A9X4RCC0_9ACTN|nr:adenosylcobinamide-GDP ribazoletransferase [Rhodococcus sp. D2-41]MDG3011933.1 adenosylcobinamide-GDP ribazoletransferase [Rhodococcus sp. D2-41]MDG3013384.1 adenosylcobinamide-GDP ribazoletransferase [Corynebacteriales bacterium D3-21]
MRGATSGIALALSWLTVLPVRGPREVDRTAGRRAIAAAPLVGVLLGLGAAGLLWVLLRLGAAPALAGVLTVGALALATRGMHVDGLSDTADGLGCYGPPERAREVMGSGAAGPFGVVTLFVCLGAQALALGSLAESGLWVAVVCGPLAGRAAVVQACRRGNPPARPTGFGALVADTQPWWAALAWTAAVVVVSGWAGANWWQGPVCVVVALLGAAALTRHCIRRFGGVNGDVLGACIEVTTTVVLIGLTLHG